MFPADDAPTARCSQRIRPTRTDGTRDELAGLTCYFDFTKPQAVLLHQNSSETCSEASRIAESCAGPIGAPAHEN